MDRRFFENDNVEDLSQNKSPKNFQKIDEEDELLNENYIWIDEEDDFSSEIDLNVMGESYEEDNLDYETQDNEDYNELEESENKYSRLDKNTTMEVNCQCDDEYSDSECYETSEYKYNCNYQYCDSDDNTSSSDDISSSDNSSSDNRWNCDCGYQYCDSEEEYECNCYESESCSNSYKYPRYNDNYSNTFEEDKVCRENKECYLRGKKEGYNAGYEAGARDAIKAAYRAGYKRGLRAAYRAGYKCGLRAAGYRI